MNALTQHFARRRKTLYVTAGLVMVVLLGVGGALAGTALSGSAPASGPSSSSGSPGTAATLNAALSSSPSATATSPAARAQRRALAGLRRLGGMYGQASFRGKDGTTRTLAYERGTVVSAEGSQTTGSAVVKAANGTTFTWRYESDTTVRKGGQKASISDVSTGEHVLVAGPITSGNRDARVIIVAPAKSSTPAPAPSSSGGTSSS
jgi:hypothetical protein